MDKIDADDCRSIKLIYHYIIIDIQYLRVSLKIHYQKAANFLLATHIRGISSFFLIFFHNSAVSSISRSQSNDVHGLCIQSEVLAFCFKQPLDFGAMKCGLNKAMFIKSYL
jgi:hypothetical protein